MQLSCDDWFSEIVIPAWQAYLAAEAALSKAVQEQDGANVKRARCLALREGGAAALYVHHFADVVARAQPSWLPGRMDVKAVRGWLGTFCTDVILLADVADALKHGSLWNQSRQVVTNDEVVVKVTHYGEMRYGEGKYGGTDQVVVLAKSGPRPLSSILQNVIEAWRRAMGSNPPPIGMP